MGLQVFEQRHEYFQSRLSAFLTRHVVPRGARPDVRTTHFIVISQLHRNARLSIQAVVFRCCRSCDGQVVEVFYVVYSGTFYQGVIEPGPLPSTKVKYYQSPFIRLLKFLILLHDFKLKTELPYPTTSPTTDRHQLSLDR